MIYPLSNAIITQYFGESPDDYLQYGYPGHNGIDPTTYDKPPIVYAFDRGRCSKVGWQEGGYGKYIIIELLNREFYYCHLESVFIKPGDQVSEGEPIALMGNTGNSSAPHLHFGIRATNGVGAPGYKGFMDPLQLLKQADQPTIQDITYLTSEPFITKLITGYKIKQSAAKPITRGKRTMYPRMKFF